MSNSKLNGKNNFKKIVCTKTNIIYNSAKEGLIKYNINLSTLHNYLKERNPNKTTLIWLK